MNKSDLKILQLVSVRWWNASAYYAISLSEGLQQIGVANTVAGREKSPPLQMALKKSLDTYTQINLETYNPLKTWQNRKRLKNLISERQISLINAHRPEDHSYGAFSIGRTKYTPLIRTISDVRAPKNHILNRWLHQSKTDYFIFSCKASYERYQNVWPIFENRSKVVLTAIDTNYFKPQNSKINLRRQLDISDDEIVIGIIARLSPVKDHKTFIKAASIISEKYSNLKFLISGEESQLTHSDLKKMAQEAGVLNKVIFLHRSPEYEIRDLIKCLDIGVVASMDSEVICRISLEYMAMEKPQIVTNINVLPEIVKEGENGFVIPAKDPAAIVDKLINLVNNKELRKSLGTSARQIAKSKYSFPVLARDTLSIYQEVFERTKR
jgi:glycosyltransferase involved in cell wall biosynthesis